MPIGENREFLLFAYPFYLLPHSRIVYLLFIIASLGTFIATAIYPYIFLRVASAILYSVKVHLLASLFYASTVWHDQYPLMTTAIFMCFVGEKKNLFLLRLIQTSLLTPYFISGFWKVRNFESLSIDYLTRVAFDDMAIASFTWGDVLAIRIFGENSPLLGLALAGVIIFQITAILPVFFNRLFFAYGVMAIFFHLSTALSTNIYSGNSVCMVILFLLWLERKHGR